MGIKILDERDKTELKMAIDSKLDDTDKQELQASIDAKLGAADKTELQQGITDAENEIKKLNTQLLNIVDYVVETGISGGWAYRVYKSGYVELRGRFSITLNAGETSKATYVTFPFNMATAYAFAQTEQQAWRLTAPVDIGIETTQVKVSYFTTAQSTAVTYHFYLFAVGIKE